MGRRAALRILACVLPPGRRDSIASYTRISHCGIAPSAGFAWSAFLLRWPAGNPSPFASIPVPRTLMRATVVLARTAALTALVWVAACGDGPTAPGIQPQITNNTDAF